MLRNATEYGTITVSGIGEKEDSMANNTGIRRMFTLLGMLGLTVLIATVCLGCANTETRNETAEATARPTELPEETGGGTGTS